MLRCKTSWAFVFSCWKLIWSEHISLFSFYTILPFHLAGFSDLFLDISLDLICFRALSILSISLNILYHSPDGGKCTIEISAQCFASVFPL